MTNGKILMIFETCKAIMKVVDMKSIVLIILLAAIWCVAEGTKRKNEKKGRNTNVWKYVSKICFIIIAIILFLYLIPVLISSFVFFPDFENLNKISGTDEQWFAFWASYSGAAVTVIIAIFTYSNSKSINKQEELFLRLFTGNNLRISKMIICPYKPESEKEEEYRYRISLKFINVSYSMIQNIEVRGFHIGLEGGSRTEDGSQKKYRKVENGVRESSYLLQGDSPYLTFDLVFRKNSEEGKKFTEFYYNDYYMKSNKLDVKIEIATTVYESAKKENVTLFLTLLMTSRFEEELESLLYSSEKEFILPTRKVMTYCYLIQNEKDK